MAGIMMHKNFSWIQIKVKSGKQNLKKVDGAHF